MRLNEVLVPIYVSFLVGCIVGALSYRSMEHDTFLIPACITGFLGLAYTTLRETFKATWKSLEQKRLVSDLDEIQSRVDRTQQTMRQMQHSRTGSRAHSLDSVEELDEQMEQVAEMMHEMENALGEMYEQDRARAR